MKPLTPQEKAEELFDKYFSEIRKPTDCEGCMQCVDKCGNMVAIAKKYALIAVDEVLNEYKSNETFTQPVSSRVFMYKRIKQEIEKL